jgi:hypothetical protein
MAKMSKSSNASKAPIKKAAKLPPMAAKAKAKGGVASKMGYKKV